MSLNRRQFIKLAGAGLGSVALSGVTAHASGGTAPDDAVAMLYDSTKCIGCKACQNACKDWNDNPPERGPDGLYDEPRELSADTWTLIQLYQEGDTRSFIKHQCMHCLDPACVSACPVHALEKTPQGPVTYDAKRCIGCRYCMVACPFDVPRFEWDETIPQIAKCTFCTDRLAVGDGPACAEACPTGALIWGTRRELLAEAQRRLTQNPDSYEGLYGDDEAGGTSVLYLSHVPFEKVGLPDLGSESVPALSDTLAPILLPSIFLGGLAVLAGGRYLAGGHSEDDQAEEKEQ
jgi:formate dehydrogenase beta subunit